MITLEQLQAENRELQLHNFPDQLPHQPLLGIIEELGELQEATEREDIADALADAVIYMANYASLNGLLLRRKRKRC